MKNKKIIDIYLPELGEGITSVEISDILIDIGDLINIEDPIIIVETEKASMEIPTTHAGKINNIHIKKDSIISPGDKIISLGIDNKTDSTEKTELIQLDLTKKNDIQLPELGEGITSVEISDLLVKKDDFINTDDPIIVVETEKASMEIPSSKSGLITDIAVRKGSIISPGDILISLTPYEKNIDKNEQLPNNEPANNDNKNLIKKESKFSEVNRKIADTGNLSMKSDLGKPVLASPSVRLFSRELGCNLRLVSGTGKKGRITKEDVQQYIKLRLSEPSTRHKTTPANTFSHNIDFSKWGEINIQPLNKIKIITGNRLQQAWQTIPHVTQFDKCDITDLEKQRIKMKNEEKYKNIKVSLIPFFIKALTILLKKYPSFNSSLDQNSNNLILKKYFNIGIAVDTPNGLVVPVIKNTDKKSIEEISKELFSISQKARERKLIPKDMEGSCFTISSLGGIGGTYFTPIINPPEVAILGISRSEYIPIYKINDLKKRLILPYSLSYDHRVIDGAAAAKFTSEFGNLIENFKKII